MKCSPPNIKNIALGITGSIAAYKGCELIRLLQKQGFNVRVVLTPSALDFITITSVTALSGKPVLIDSSYKHSQTSIEHIDLSKWADLFLIAPITANSIAKLAFGFADNALNACFLATDALKMIAPAMNQGMWHNPLTQRNLQTLETIGIQILPPQTGEQACGDWGTGNMMSPESITEVVLSNRSQTNHPLSGKKVLITAGASREWIDPIRYITNSASGKTGIYLAQECLNVGAIPTLIALNVQAPIPQGIEVIHLQQADSFFQHVTTLYSDYDLVIATAAVGDVTPQNPSTHKLKKDAFQTIHLTQTGDSLKTIGEKRFVDKKKTPVLVGFCAETRDLKQQSAQKRSAKHLDMIVANHILEANSMGSDYNEVWAITESEALSLKGHKQTISHQLIESIGQFFFS